MTVHKRLSTNLARHKKASGLYAFYDLMADLIHLGKPTATCRARCISRSKPKYSGGILPEAISDDAKRVDVVRYISAYSIPTSDHAGYAKHVEGLILRVSKPRLNKNLGSLKTAGIRLFFWPNGQEEALSVFAAVAARGRARERPGAS